MFFKPNSLKDYLIHLVLIIAISIGVVYYFFDSYLPEHTRHGEEIEVPDLSGKSISEAEVVLADLGLKYTINDSTYIPGESPNKVLTQHPIKGNKVKANRKIYLSVTSRYATNVEMPNLVNQNYKAANLILSQLGLQIGDTTIVTDQFPLILKQYYKGKEIKPGTVLPKYSKINLIIGDGKDNYEDDESY